MDCFEEGFEFVLEEEQKIVEGDVNAKEKRDNAKKYILSALKEFGLNPSFGALKKRKRVKEATKDNIMTLQEQNANWKESCVALGVSTETAKRWKEQKFQMN